LISSATPQKSAKSRAQVAYAELAYNKAENKDSEMQSSPRWLLGCLFSAVVFGFGVLMLFSMALSSMGGAPVQHQLVEVEEDTRANAIGKIAVIELSGVISSEPPNGGVTQYALQALKRATNDSEVRVILLEIDSPGGGVTDSDRVHHAVEKAKKAGKKVYVFFGNLCASGGYYIAVAADEIWSRPTSITGSIGVIVPSFSAQGLLEKMGVIDQSVSSGENKQILGVTKDMNTEQEALIQGVVDSMYDRFVGLVVQGRGLSLDTVKTLADGRLFSAEQALEAKLVDRIGYRDDLLSAIRGDVGGDLSIVRYRGHQSFLEMLLGSQVKLVLNRVLGSRAMSTSTPSYLLN
jgi:protease IV